MSAEEDLQLLKPVDRSLVNASEDEMMMAGSNETWSKKAFGDARLIFAVLPPPIVITGVIVNVVLLVLTAARQGGLRRHPTGVYVGALCVCFGGLLVVDSGIQEWASFITRGPITDRAPWLCRGVPFAVSLVRTSACWLTVCALVDRCLALSAALRTPEDSSVTEQPHASTSQRKTEPSTSAAEVGLLLPTEEGGLLTKKSTAGGESADVEDDPQVRRRPLLCRPIAVMLLTAGVFVAMALANSPLLIRRWIRAQPTLRCLVPYHMNRLCSMMSYGTTTVPLMIALLLFFVVLVLLAVTACRRNVPDADDTKLVLVMSSPVAVFLFVVELLRVLCSYNVIDDLGGIVQELSELVFYAVVALVPALCFLVAPSVRVTYHSRGTRAVETAAPATADETIRLSTVDGNEVQ